MYTIILTNFHETFLNKNQNSLVNIMMNSLQYILERL
jgi:hypothetical protein